MPCPDHSAFDPRCHACIDAAAGQVGATGHPMAGGLSITVTHDPPTAENRAQRTMPPMTVLVEPRDDLDRAIIRDVLASGPIRPGYQHSPATWVEGREAPKREHPLARRMAACFTGDVETALGIPPRPTPDPDAATVEACARAALDGYEGNDPPMYSSDWGQLPEDDRDAWRDVARAVLAAARGGR